MKKILATLLAVILLIGVAGCGGQGASGAEKPKQEPDFRTINWGMSVEEVMDAEPTTGQTYENSLLYSDLSVLNMKCTLVYLFNESDKLYAAVYSFNEIYGNPNLYINDYDYVIEQLTAKYGEPISNDAEWLVNSSLWNKDNPDDCGFAVYYGELKYTAIWHLNNMIIAASLSGNNDITFTLTYMSSEFDKGDNGDSNF